MKVAIGLLFNKKNQVLIAERQAYQSQPGLWEFPGGKLEINETDFEALKRELSEEVGIEIISADHWLDIEYDYLDKTVSLSVWRVREWLHEPIGKEGQVIRWISLCNLDHFKFPAGNRLILDKLLQKSG